MADENTERRRTLILRKIDRQWNEKEKADNGAGVLQYVQVALDREWPSFFFFFGAISFPESLFPSTSGRKTRALGATILKQPNSGDSAYPVSLRSLHLRRMPEMVAPRALVFRPLVKGNEDSGNEIVFGEKTFTHANTLT